MGNSEREIKLCGGLHQGNIWFNGPDGNDIEEPMSPLEAMLESHPQIRDHHQAVQKQLDS